MKQTQKLKIRIYCLSFLTVYLGRFSLPTCHILPRSHSSSIYLLYVHQVIFFVSPLRSITFHLISMKPQTTNIWEEKQPLRDENRLGGGAIIVRLDSFVFTRLLSFLLLCVINIERAWRTDGGMRDGWREGCSCCLASFCFLTDTTKSFRRGKTVVFVCRHRVMLPVPTERGWMKELLRQQTHHPSVCQREREREKWKTVGEKKRARDEDKERDCVRRRQGIKNRNKKRLKGAENRDKEPERTILSCVFSSFLLCCSNKKRNYTYSYLLKTL